MRCPHCGAEVTGRFCEYCDSEMIFTGEGRDIEDVLPMQTVEELCQELLADKEVSKACYASMLMGPDGNRTVKGYKINKRLLKTLQIPEEDSIYLIHDDTMAHNGKNGFAITSSGFYTRELLSNPVHVGWEQFAQADTIVKESVKILADEMLIAYTCDGGSAIITAITNMDKKILKMVKQYGNKVI